MKPLGGLLIVLALSLPGAARAQDVDILMGKLIGIDGKPVAAARVTAMSIETEITRSTITDKNGRYQIVFPDGGGRYLLRFSFLGMQEALRTVMREAGEELLVTNLTMQPQPIQLAGIEVTANRRPPTDGRSGDQSTDLSLDMLSRLPLPDMDPATLALLAAGVVGTGLDSLSGRMGFSVAGMSDLLNQITLDGMILAEGGIQVPELGLRMTQITTSTFDVSRGGFAGGQVSMSSARGNNRTSARLQYRLEDDALQMSATPVSNPTTNQTIGIGVGGPIIRNRLFYNASFDLRRNVTHRFALSATDPLGGTRSGVATDSIARFLDILGNRYGFPVEDQTGPYNQFQDVFNPQLRLDWNIADGHTLSTSFNASVNDQDSTRISNVDLFQHGGESASDSRRGLMTLTSRLPGVLTNLTNHLRLSLSESSSEALPYIRMPEGRVSVNSEFEDGTRQRGTLVFGGNRSLPTESYRRDVQLSNDLSFILNLGDQIHRLKTGAIVQRNRSVNRSTQNLFGTFQFNSLADFENNRPASFDRSLSERNIRSGTYSTGFYLGDTWRPTTPLEITLGVRWDFARLDQKPRYNPAVEQAFGRRTDFDPSASTLSPRLGFNLRLNQPGTPTRAITGGIGLSAGSAPMSIYADAVRQTGLPDAEQSLRCIGDVVPIPDWDLFATGDIDVIPTTCLDGGVGSPVFSSRAPNVTLINPDQRMPASLRAEIGYRTQLPFRIQSNLRYTYSRGIGLWGYRDINLNESSAFTLGLENRPFFGDASAIVTTTGSVSSVPSRLHPEFGNVYDVTSDLASSTHTFTTQLNALLPGNIRGSANYTLQFARDQGSGSFSSATTAGNPNVREWSASNSDRRHTLNLNLSYPFTNWFEVTASGRISSGSPFTPMVLGDINGDGVSNDRAFIFDPRATADTAVANAMDRLLENVPGRIRDCLERQFGQIAQRNSCRNGWSQSLNMALSLRPGLPTLGRRLTVRADLNNVLSGLDQLVHGKDGIKGWGESPSGDRRLLDPQGFDPVSNRFIYEVNEGFGQSRRGSGAFRSVFSVRLQANIAVGGQQDNRGFQAPIAFGGFGGFPGEGGRGDGGGFGQLGALGAFFRGTASPDSLDSLLGRVLRNPLPVLLARKDSLGLNEQQATNLQAISDTLDSQLQNRRVALRGRAETLKLAGLIPQYDPNGNTGSGNNRSGGGADGGRSGGRGGGRGGERGAGPGGFSGGQPVNPELARQIQLEIQPQVDGARREIAEAVRLAQHELTPEQWQKVPPQVRNAGQTGGGRGGGQGGFNAVGILDRLLANPIPVLLELKDTLKLTPEQVTQIQAISTKLGEKLTQRRQELGRRFDNVQGGEQQAQVFQRIRPELDATRREVRDALSAVQKLLTEAQWRQIPERIRNPFENDGEDLLRRLEGRRGGRGDY